MHGFWIMQRTKTSVMENLGISKTMVIEICGALAMK